MHMIDDGLLLNFFATLLNNKSALATCLYLPNDFVLQSLKHKSKSYIVMLQQSKTLNDAEKNLWHQYSMVFQWSAVFIRNNYLINFIKNFTKKLH